MPKEIPLDDGHSDAEELLEKDLQCLLDQIDPRMATDAADEEREDEARGF